VKHISNRPLTFDTKDIKYEHILDDTSKSRPDLLQDYPDAFEEVDNNFPRAFDVHSKLLFVVMLFMRMIA